MQLIPSQRRADPCWLLTSVLHPCHLFCQLQAPPGHQATEQRTGVSSKNIFISQGDTFQIRTEVTCTEMHHGDEDGGRGGGGGDAPKWAVGTTTPPPRAVTGATQVFMTIPSTQISNHQKTAMGSSLGCVGALHIIN